MGLIATERNRTGDWLRWEEDNFYSRERVTVTSGQKLVDGTVVGKITSTGKVTMLDPSATDGSEVAYGILVGDCDASDADTEGVCIVRHAIITTDTLTWPDGITEEEKNTALGQLANNGIIVRDEN